MAIINIQPLFMKDVVFSVGTDSYEKHVSSVMFTPATTSVSWKGLEPSATYTNVGTATWNVDISFAQDWETANSLSAYLFDNQGETKTVVFEPVNGGQGFTADIIIVAGAIGGAVDSYAETTVSLPVQGQPTRTI